MGLFKDTSLYKYAKRVTSFTSNRGQVFQMVLNNDQIKRLIIFLNTVKQQRVQHVDSKGAPLTNQFSDRTTYSLFDPKGRGGKPYQLFDAGDYHASYVITVGAGFIDIDSNPIKDGESLFDMFGEEIEGLTPENLEILRKEALILYDNFYRKLLIP